MNTRLLKLTSLVMLLGLQLAGGGGSPAWAQPPQPGAVPVFNPATGTGYLTSAPATMVVQGDFNLDQVMDLAVTSEFTGKVTILLGPDFGTPAGASNPQILSPGSSVSPHPVHLAVGDFDKNGKPDLVVVNQLEGTATVFKNMTDPSGFLTFTETNITVPQVAPSWIGVSSGLTNLTIKSLAITGSSTVFAGTDGGGVFRSTDNGANWAPFNGTTNVLGNLFVNSLAVSGTNLIAGTNAGIYKTSINASPASWSLGTGTGISSRVCKSLAVSGNTVYGGTDNGVYKSTNNGVAWTSFNAGYTSDVLSLALNSSFVFAGTPGTGVYRSSTNSAGWGPFNNGLSQQSVQALAVIGSNLFAGTLDGVFRSTNNAGDWTQTNTNAMVANNALEVQSLAASGNSLFAGTANGFFCSTNRGTTWSYVETGLTNSTVFSLAVNGGYVFAGTQGGGVYRIGLTVPTEPLQVAVADVDRDGNLDFATANKLSNTISVFFGDGSGVAFDDVTTYTIAPVFDPSSVTNPSSLVFVNLNSNNSSFPDLVVGTTSGRRIFVLVNTGLPNDPSARDPYRGFGNLNNPTEYIVGSSPGMVAVGDLNGDAKADVVVANGGGDGHASIISVLFGNGDGFLGTAPCASGCGPFQRLDITGIGLDPQGIVVGDVNGDSYSDIAVVQSTDDSVKVFRGNGLGCFGSTSSCAGAWDPTAFLAGLAPRGIGLGDVTGDARPDLYVANTQITSTARGVTLFTNNLNGATACAALQASPNPRCISGTNPCVSLDVSLTGAPTDGDTRAYCVKLRLSPNLLLCVSDTTTEAGLHAAITPGTYLGGTTALKVAQSLNADGSHTVTIDEVILNPGIQPTTCNGPRSGSGLLFSIAVKKSANALASDVGKVDVTGLTLRTCGNNSRTAFACATAPQAQITITNSTSAIAGSNLRVSQKLTGNGGGGRTQIDLDWDPPGSTAGTTIDIWRAPYPGVASEGKADFSGYPDYRGIAPSLPNSASDLYGGATPRVPWKRIAQGLAGGTDTYPNANTDFPLAANNHPARGYWYYAVVRLDGCGQPSAPLISDNAGTLSGDGGTLNYHICDVADAAGGELCVGDNNNDELDFSAINLNFCTTCDVSYGNTVACQDLYPTSGVATGHPFDGRPLRNDPKRIESQDQFMVLNSAGSRNLPQLAKLPLPADRDEVGLTAPKLVTAGATFSAAIRLKGAGNMHGVAVQLAWDHALADLISIQAGELAERQGAIVLAPPQDPGMVIAGVPGLDRPGFLGEGVLATVTFRAKVTGDPSVSIASLEGRDLKMRLVLGSDGSRPAPSVTSLATASPNPFQQRVVLGFSLATEGHADMSIFSVEGRRVKTLWSGTRPAGAYNLEWDGTDEAGRTVEPGVYFVRLLTGSRRFTHTLVHLK